MPSIPDGSRIAEPASDEDAANELILELLEGIKDELVTQNTHLDSLRKLMALAMQSTPAASAPQATPEKSPSLTPFGVAIVLADYGDYLVTKGFTTQAINFQKRFLMKFHRSTGERLLTATLADVRNYCQNLPVSQAKRVFENLFLFYGWRRGHASILAEFKTIESFIATL